MEISSMFPGFRFSPTDQELISHYLKRKIDGLEESGEVIAEVDICKFEPWDLPGKSVIPSDHEWFFFSPNGRKYPNGSQARRATEIGFWKATGKDRSIKSGTNVIGTKRTLVFHIGRAPKGERTDWIMHEYCIKGNKVDKSQDSFVICRLRKKMDFTQTTDSQCRESASHDGSLPANVSLDAASQVGRDMLQDSNLKVVEDDCFADILKDDIIKLEDIRLRPLQLPVVEENPETENKLTQPTEPARMSQVHPTQGIANRRIRLQTQLSRWKGREMLGADGDGYVTKAIQGDDDKMLMKSWKSNKSRYGCMIVTILLIVVIVFVVSSQQLLRETLPIRF